MSDERLEIICDVLKVVCIVLAAIVLIADVACCVRPDREAKAFTAK